MSKYTVEHTCGHTCRIDLIGTHKSREWRLERMAKEPCDDCWRQQREVENARRNAEAAITARELELLPLVGTDKQVSWAGTIRVDLLGALERQIEVSPALRNHQHLPELLQRLHAETRASWWIDNRNEQPYVLLRDLLGQVKPVTIPTTSQLEAAAEVMVRPEKPVTESVAEIRIAGSSLEIAFPERRDDFRLLVRDLGYKWAETRWLRPLGPFTGPAEDRAAEVGHRLLAAGFPVRIYDEQIRARAVAADYTPEPRRWITQQLDGRYADWFRIRWPKGDDYYAVARKLTGSHYSEGVVYVPAERYAQVLDFASLFGFAVSPGAQGLADNARAIREVALVVNVSPPARTRHEAISGKPPLLPIPEVEIANELRDD